MQPNIESLGALQRRLDLSLASADVSAEVERRLERIARESRMPGFRRGKVPVKIIARQHGAQVQAEVVSDRVGEALGRALEQSRLRIAGRPQIEMRPEADPAQLHFRATFEIYPEVEPPDPARLSVQRAVCPVGEGEIDKTLEVMRRQRARLQVAARAARDGDRVTIDFRGTLEGVPFEGGTASGYAFDLGSGRMLSGFEIACRGLAAGESREFDLEFPADYHGAAVAGRTARFRVEMKQVEERVLPEIDADFVRSLGIDDGEIAHLRAEVRENVEREVATRIRSRTRESVLDALAGAATFEVPRSLVAEEQERLHAIARQEMQSRGLTEIPGPEAFGPGALRRVRLVLIVGEIVRRNSLEARPDQVRAAVEVIARSYEKPEQVVQWYLGDRSRYAEIESQVMEDNVIEWVLRSAQSVDVPVSFDDLMEGARAAGGTQ